MAMLVYLVMIILPVSVVNAHESWLQPVDYQLPLHTVAKLDVVTGQNFSGHRLSFNPARFARLQSGDEVEIKNISGRLGDLPAVQFQPSNEGLYSIVYQTNGSEIHYDSAEKFRQFAEKEGVEWIIEEHKKRDLPASDFSETFIRYSKTLVAVGHGRGRDRVMGMPFELVALQNPMHPETDQLTLRLVWKGKAESGLLSVYEKTMDREVTLQTFQIAENGEVKIRLQPNRQYLLNTVKMEAVLNSQEDQPVWRSHWASLTFSTEFTTGIE